ncbi:MAG: hypothetical protein D6816_17075 [Bacteroidetes bacterium]|nr:MAG: hypothetical protein D6816_17075 [Bacteroidota bacterium]
MVTITVVSPATFAGVVPSIDLLKDYQVVSASSTAIDVAGGTITLQVTVQDQATADAIAADPKYTVVG